MAHNDAATQYFYDRLTELDAKRQELEALGSSDPEMAQLVQEELASLEQESAALRSTLDSIESAAVTTGPEFHNCILEVRPGAGGEESKLFMRELLETYLRYAERKHFKIEPVDEDVIKIKGKTAYTTFKFESGVHRVQRVPTTEAQGRIHTSTCTVAVIPEIPAAVVEIRPDELDWQFYRAGGHGGQNVNKVSTAVRLTHIPTGVVVTASQERHQAQNREKALEQLRGKLWEVQEEKRLAELGDARSAIGTAARAEKIRTYNFPQNRLTDHRVPFSWYDLDRRMLGDWDEVVEKLQEWERGANEGSVGGENAKNDSVEE